MSYTGQIVNYTSSVKYAAVAAWGAAAGKSAGNLVRQLVAPTNGNERVFVALNAGTTGGTEPVWTFNRGDKQPSDNGIIWQEVTGVAAFNGDITNTPNWIAGAKSTTPSLGHTIKDAAGTHIFICTTSGAAGTGAEPTWVTTSIGSTTVDASATWTYMGTSFANWAAPHHHLRNAQQTNWGDAPIAKFFVGHDHAYLSPTGASTYSWQARGTMSAPVDVLCVSTAGSVPPVSADLALTGSEGCAPGGNNNMQITGALRVCYGLIFNPDRAISINANDSTDKNFESCQFRPGGSGNPMISFKDGNAEGFTTLLNCKLKFAATSSGISTSGAMEMIGGSIDTGGSVPASLISNGGSSDTKFTFRGVDLSFLSSSTLYTDGGGGPDHIFQFLDCKMPATYTPTTTITSNLSRATCQMYISRCDNSGTNYKFTYTDPTGRIDADAVVVRTGGALDGAQNFSWKFVTTIYANAGNDPLQTPKIGIWNPTTAANVTVTLRGIVNAAAVPTDHDMWMEVDYHGASGNPQSTHASTRFADYLAAPINLTADNTSAWDTNASARLNSHTYVVGDVIKLATNPNRIFFCTATTGNTASSEPGGYASAVDGGSVTDGLATFRAGCRFSMTVILSSPQPQIAGNLYATVKVAKPSTTTYVDPQIILS
jgi:hypothetical protein